MLDHLGTQAARKVDGDTMTVMSTNPIMCVYIYTMVMRMTVMMIHGSLGSAA